jgi:hypothetical protein
MTSKISKTIKIKIINEKKENDFKTFVELFEFLQTFEGDLKEWLSIKWDGKDKQESLLRLFSFLGLIEKLNNFDICKGNFNKHTIKKIKLNRSFFYDSKNKKRNLKDKGDSSDLTGIGKKNKKHLLVTTSKNINKENVGKLDIDTSEFKWLPNYNMELVKKLLAVGDEDKCGIIYDRTAYGADKKKRVSKNKDAIFQYPCIHSTPKSGVRYMYSKFNDKGHFGVSKIIFGESGIYNPVIDIEGKYGITHGAMGIEITYINNANDVCTAITSNAFKDLTKSCNYSSFRIDWNIFKYFKRDFWKDFI